MNLKLKKVWAWIKKCWYVPALAIFILLAIILCPLCATSDNKLFKMFKASKDSYKKEVDAINKAQEEKEKKKDELYAKYVETMKNLSTEHNVDMDALEENKKKKLDTLVKKYKGTPDELAKELSDMFGADYVE